VSIEERAPTGEGSERPAVFQRLRELPVIGRAADWGMGSHAVSKKTKQAGARTAGLKATESVCPYCAVGCGPGRLHARRRARRHRGQSRTRPSARARSAPRARLAPAHPAAGPAEQGQYRRPRHGVGGARARDSDGHDRRAAHRRARERLAGRTTTAGGRPHARPSRTSAAPRSTTRRTTSSRSSTRRWARSRSRTRPAYDTPLRSPVWGPRSGGEPPPTTSRTSRTLTASGSRGRRSWRRTPWDPAGR
jgi:hypothetical protein